MLDITSPANPRVKELVALRRRRNRSDRTLVEGREELALALSAGVRPLSLYHCPDLATDDGLVGRVRALGAEVVTLSRAAFDRVAYRESPDGWLAVVPAVETRLDRLALPPDPLLIVCEGLEKPGNLGAILRTADAAGVAAVLSADQVTDWGNPNLVRASKGTVFSVPVAAGSTAEVLDWLAARSVRVVATTPDTDTLVTGVDLTGAVAVAVGSEKHGLSDRFRAAAQVRARIPMFGRADSLNAATSAAIVVYESVRQRLSAAPAPPPA